MSIAGVGVAGMREDLFVFFEPGVHCVPVEPDRVAQLLERRILVADGSANCILASRANGEGLPVASAG